MRSTLIRGGAALAVLAVAVFAVGFPAQSADAQVPVSPVAIVNGPYQAVVGQTVELDATSFTPLASATWTFSDGVSLSGLTVVRSFDVPGTYTATLTATDIYGFMYQAATTVTVYDGSFAGFVSPIALSSGVLTPGAFFPGTFFPGTVQPLTAEQLAAFLAAQQLIPQQLTTAWPSTILPLQANCWPNGVQIVNGVLVCSQIPIDPRGLPGN